MSSATLQFREPHPVVETVLIFTAVAATLLGIAVCLQDRDWAGTLLLSPFVAYLRPTSAVLGAFGGFLPALLHTYAMPVLLIAALRPWPRTRPRVCLLWFSIAWTLDWLQSGVTDAWFQAGDRLPGDMPLPGYPGSHAVQGQLDIVDLLATAIGCVTALAVTIAIAQRVAGRQA